MTDKAVFTFTGKDMMNFETTHPAESYSSTNDQAQISLSAEEANSVRGFFNAFVLSLLFWAALILFVIYLCNYSGT